MGDLFHEDVPDEWIDRVFAVMALAPQHTFQVLTKRSARMRAYLFDPTTTRRIYTLVCEMTVALEPGVVLIARPEHEKHAPPGPRVYLDLWPLPNVWLGVSAERQQEAAERIPDLLATPAAIRFVSAEPLLGPIDFTRIARQPNGYDQQMPGLAHVTQLYVDALAGNEGITYKTPQGGEMSAETCFGNKLDWIITGGESGQGARPMHYTWVRSIRDQCATADVPFFFKQWGTWLPICAMEDGQVDTYFDPAPERHPEAVRHCRVEQCILNADGARIDLNVWSRITSKNASLAYAAGMHSMQMFRVGKKAAFRLLDGVEHNGMPVVSEVPSL